MRTRGRRRAARLAFSRQDLIRLAPIFLFALAALALTVVVSAANIVRDVRPDIALRMMPIDARAKAKAAEREIAAFQQRRGSVAEAERLAKEALRRDATIASAWRTLGLVAALGNRPQAANRLFRSAERVSRRDGPTQLWLIEEAVGRNDVPGVLHHYDVALSTSRASHALLLPILIEAMATEDVATHLAPLVARRPPWHEAFLRALVEQPPQGDHFLRLLERLRGTPGQPEPELLGELVSKLVDTHRYAQAFGLYRQLRGGAASAAPLRNGGFGEDNPIPPFDWLLEQGADLIAEQRAERGNGQGQSLQIFAASGAGGNAASQLLVLAPGSYSLSGRAGAGQGAGPARLVWTIACAGGGATLLELSVPTRAQRGAAHQGAFRVPARCAAQRLSLSVIADFGPEGTAAWVDSVALRRN